MTRSPINSNALNVPLTGPEGIRSASRWPRRLWLGYILSIYSYLYLCMWRGAPFVAYDHVNYINFLNEPHFFLFEPGYTAIGFLLNAVCAESLRFPVIFMIFTLPPLVLAIRSEWQCKVLGLNLFIYACILTKAFYIGFVTQRFFFAELWVTATILSIGLIRRLSYKDLIPGFVLHFSAFTILPSLLWLRGRFNWSKVAMGLVLVITAFLFMKYASDLQMFGYNYARYKDPDSLEGGFSLFSLLEMVVLALICHWVVPRKFAMNFVTLIALITVVKMTFGEIEVFSRVFQIQVDFVIIAAAKLSRRPMLPLFSFSFGFLLIQLLFTPNAAEMFAYHSIAVSNALFGS